MPQFDIKTREIEYKYNAQSVKMDKFIEFARSLKPEKELQVASWDIYYAHPKSTSLPFDFMRLRMGNTPELTVKIKTTEINNNDRIEIDVPLRPIPFLSEIVSAFVKLFGFEENFRIHKYCEIFFFEKADMVYYIAHNENMEETGRYIEIEARKDVEFSSHEEAVALVKEWEQKLSYLGITPQHRIKKSQWEMNKRSK